jgi:ASC-1-like (ASCH) protein
MAAVEKIKNYRDFKKAIRQSEYKPMKALKDSQPALYDEYKGKMKKEQDKERGVIAI